VEVEKLKAGRVKHKLLGIPIGENPFGRTCLEDGEMEREVRREWRENTSIVYSGEKSF